MLRVADEQLKLLETLYKDLKKESYRYYVNGQMIEQYKKLKEMIVLFEYNMELDYICDTTIEEKETKTIDSNTIDIVHKYEPEDILNYIVSLVRKSLVNGNCIENFDLLDATNQCYVASKNISFVCDEILHIKSERLRINSGYDDSVSLYNGAGYHYFNIVTILGKKYLVDCTYKQFFKVNRSSLEKLGVPLLSPPYPGTFMILNEERKRVSDTILKQGWIEATEENLKHYFDGFTLSFRNGLYYENLGKISYEADYTVEDYMRFITTSDSQLKRENIQFIGPQYKPLEDYRLNFKIK